MHDPLTYRYPRTMIDAFGCNAAEAVALHRYTQPLHQRLFYALIKWGWVVVLLALFALAGCDSAAAVSVAAKEADSRRDVAAQAMCGPGAVVQWLDASTTECLNEKEKP